MAEAVEIIIIAVLTLVTIICIIAVIMLVRWLRKVKRNIEDHEYHDALGSDASSDVDESIFEPSEPGSPAVWGSSTPTGTFQRNGKQGVFGGEPPLTKRKNPRPRSDEFEEDDWSDMLLPPHQSAGTGAGQESYMFDLDVMTSDNFSVRRSRKVYIPHVSNLGELGLTVSGDAPVKIYSVDLGSAGAIAGLRAGDEILSISGVPCARARHQEVVDLFTRVITTAQPQAVISPRKNSAPDDLPGFGASHGALPGQIGAGPSIGPTDTFHVDPVDDDPYAAIREAASRNQVEAARLMQTENFREARILLDKAIILLQSIPQISAAKAAESSGKAGIGRADDNTARRPRRKRKMGLSGFRAVRGGKRDSVTFSNKKLPAPRGKQQSAQRRAILTITKLDQLPNIGFKPIHRHRLSARQKPGSSRSSRVNASTASASSARSSRTAWGD